MGKMSVPNIKNLGFINMMLICDYNIRSIFCIGLIIKGLFIDNNYLQIMWSIIASTY